MTPSISIGTAMPLIHIVNIILVEAIFVGILFFLCLILHCCHRNAPQEEPDPQPFLGNLPSPLPALSYPRHHEFAQPTIPPDLLPPYELVSSDMNYGRRAVGEAPLRFEYETRV